MYLQEQQSNYNQLNLESVKKNQMIPIQSLLIDLSLPFQQSKSQAKIQFQQENISSGCSTHCDSDSDSLSQSTPIKTFKNQQIQQQQMQNQQNQQQSKKILNTHELHALQQQQNYKTEICRNWRQNGGVCQYGKKCRYAHGEEDLNRRANVNEYFKTRECKLFHQEGYCSYGIRCHFIHVNKTLEDVKRESKLTKEACLEKGIILQKEKSRFEFAQEKKQQEKPVEKKEIGFLEQLQLPKIQQNKKMQMKMKEAYQIQQQQQQQNMNQNQFEYLQYLNQTKNVNYQQFQQNQQQTCFA